MYRFKLFQVYDDGGIQCIRLTRFMKFIIAIVRMLEQRVRPYRHSRRLGKLQHRDFRRSTERKRYSYINAKTKADKQ